MITPLYVDIQPPVSKTRSYGCDRFHLTSKETLSHVTTAHQLTLKIGHFPGLPRQNKITTWAFKHTERNTKWASPLVKQNSQNWFPCPTKTSHLSIKVSSLPPRLLISTILPASGRWTLFDPTHGMQCWCVCGWLIPPGKTSSELARSITNDRRAGLMDALISWI